MYRVYALGLLIALLGGMLLQGFASYRHAVAAAYDRGHAEGAAQLQLKLDQQSALQSQASQALVADANRRISQLEQQHAKLETDYVQLEKAASGRAGRGPCLDARLVHFLAAIRAR